MADSDPATRARIIGAAAWTMLLHATGFNVGLLLGLGFNHGVAPVTLTAIIAASVALGYTAGRFGNPYDLTPGPAEASFTERDIVEISAGVWDLAGNLAHEHAHQCPSPGRGCAFHLHDAYKRTADQLLQSRLGDHT